MEYVFSVILRLVKIIQATRKKALKQKLVLKLGIRSNDQLPSPNFSIVTGRWRVLKQ